VYELLNETVDEQKRVMYNVYKDTFVKQERKATTSFIISVCARGRIEFPLDRFS